MIIFFYFKKPTRVMRKEFGFAYEHKFDAVPDNNEQIPFDKVYYSTPSDFNNHLKHIKEQMGKEMPEIRIIDPPKIVNRPEFPVHIGFQNLQEALEPYKGRPSVSLAVLNAMSNALGDHLIGMQAFDYWADKVRELLPGTTVDITLYQLNPYRVGPITKQWQAKFSKIFMLPNRLSRFMDHDGFVDLGTLLLREDFDTQPMIDFFYQAMSIDPDTVPVERKRIKYTLKDETVAKCKNILHNIRALGRPILMFHHTSTSPIRGMSHARARQFITEIIKKTDYFVVSACGLEHHDKRFMNLANYSETFDDFCTFISMMDAIITVDTSTYHVSDAFDVPTVALFTTINPDFRTRYYPYVESIMLEEKDGQLYGRHKASENEEAKSKEIEYVEEKWANLDVEDVLSALETAKKR